MRALLLLLLLLLACMLGRDQQAVEAFSPASRFVTRALLGVSQQQQHQPSGTSTRLLRLGGVSMVSVGGGGGGGSAPPTKKPAVGFLISPSPSTGEDEMLILQNMNAIASGESTKLGIIGTNDLADGHKQMVELLTYALVLSGNHIYTSGGGNGTNRAVISGALRACNADLLTVILPQSILRQDPDMQVLLMRVANLVQQPELDDMDFKEAAQLCNDKIIKAVNKLLVFAYHDSSTVLKSAFAAEEIPEMEVIIFYLD